MVATPQDVLTFWEEAGEEKWWKKDDAFDAEIADKFGETHRAASAGELADWEQEPQSALALVLVLDQFSRNLHRDSPLAFANDPACRDLVHRMIARGDDAKLEEPLAPFVYLPLMHAENLADQELCIEKIAPFGENYEKFAIIHRDIIRDFGRFPHRNKVLGRETTPEEQAFLDEGGFSG